MSTWQALLQLMALGMMISVVCRAVKMNETTAEPVRLAMVAHGGAAFALAVFPFGKPHWLPWLVVAYMATGLLVQWATASYWSRGQPKHFERIAKGTP